uniref:Transcription factor TFIIIB component B'' Myb domain-containing protein n=1 Tax=Neogobius melanostomus TaxID=47308 RepID=A0A8C6UHY8_9GOBI
MFRRSRLSIRPNVGIAGRTAGSPQETLINKDQEDDTNTGVETPVSVSDNKSADPPTEQTSGIDQNGEAPSSSAIQRRKRFSVRPKVVPGRPSALPRTAKPPIKPILPTVKSPAPMIDKVETLIEVNSTASHQELQTPKECQPSNESRSSKIDAALPSEGSSKCIDQHGKTQSSLCSQVKEISSKAPVPHSLPDREAIDILEKAKTLVSRTELKAPSQNFSLTQLLNDKSDLLRLEKARKLRQLLKQEMLKEKSKKCMARVKECTLDPAKMTMRDLIHYLPTSNPMSPGHREATATTSVEGHQAHEEEPEEEAEEAEEAAEDDDALMVPQVKVAEDGSLIIDEERLVTFQTLSSGKGPTQTLFCCSFLETDMFFLAISMVGTDFAMISQLFPHRARSEIKVSTVLKRKAKNMYHM